VSALYGGKWSGSQACRFIPRKNTPVPIEKKKKVGNKVCAETLEKGILSFPCLE
jgi:hypothetical protein